MSKKTRSNTIFLGATLLLFIIYLGYQVVNALSGELKTVDAVLVNVEDKLSSEGVFIREQVIIEGSAGKNAEILVENGEKVANGQKIAMFFDNQQAVDVYREHKTLSDKIKSDSYAYDHMSDGADGLKLDGLILTNMINIISGLEQGVIGSVENSYSDIKQIVAQRDGQKLTQSEFNAKQSEMRKELSELNTRMSGSSNSVNSPKSGYFVSGVDGYENVFSIKNMDKLTADMISNTEKYRETLPDTAIGSLIDGYKWQYATVITKEQATGLKKGDNVKVRFPQLNTEPLDMVITDIRGETGGQIIIIFQSAVMQQMYFNPRIEPADIIKKSYSGIKVPADALRQVDGEWGVYCLVGAVVKFKPVEWVYQTESYYLVKQAENSKKGLYNYDKIIISSEDLEDGAGAK